ncbi:hypothetical protein C8R46DRAFT_902606, partial [Mycena filopes]
VSTIFTAGIRTNGRVEGENRVTKNISGPGKNLFQVFNALNTRTKEQAKDTLIRSILDLLRLYAGPFALQTSHKQMEQSLYYTAHALQLPQGMRTWQSRNRFTNDRAYIGTRFLLRLVQEKGLVPLHLIKIVHTASQATHYLVLFADGRYMCDCCMQESLGVACRHYFTAWIKIPGLPFNISLIRAR